MQDMNIMQRIEWEAVVIDECQQPRSFAFLDEFLKLKTQRRLFPFNGNLEVYIFKCTHITTQYHVLSYLPVPIFVGKYLQVP